MMGEIADFLQSRKKANLTIVTINIIVFLVTEIMGDTTDASFILRCGGCYGPLVSQGEYWRLFSSMFLHFGFYHIAQNMLCLIFLGDILETIVGPWRYLFIYLLGGLFGSVFFLKLSLSENLATVSAGASGAIFSVIGALFYITLRNRERIGKSNMKRMILMVVLMIAQGVDNTAHLGGFIAGFLLGILVTAKGKEGLWRN